MPDIPKGAKKPSDRKRSEHDVKLEEAELLADLPELKAANRLRPVYRNKVMRMLAELRTFAGDDGDTNDDEAAISLEVDPDDPEFATFLNLVEQIDQFAESIATDPDTYVAWAELASYEQFSAILTRYGRAVGESSSSSD